MLAILTMMMVEMAATPMLWSVKCHCHYHYSPLFSINFPWFIHSHCFLLSHLSLPRLGTHRHSTQFQQRLHSTCTNGTSSISHTKSTRSISFVAILLASYCKLHPSEIVVRQRFWTRMLEFIQFCFTFRIQCRFFGGHSDHLHQTRNIGYNYSFNNYFLDVYCHFNSRSRSNCSFAQHTTQRKCNFLIQSLTSAVPSYHLIRMHLFVHRNWCGRMDSTRRLDRHR